MAAESLVFLSRGAQFGFSGCGVAVFLRWLSTIFLKIVVEAMTSGQPQLRHLWFGVSKCMLPVRHPAPKIIMVVNDCLHQLARMFWVAPAYHEKEGATPHPGACWHSLQYDKRTDGCFRVRVGMLNLCSLSGKGGEVCEELIKRMIYVCYLQEEKWRGQDGRMLG